MRKGAKKLSLLVFILGVFLIVTGSYAIYRGTYAGENDNKIVTDSASLEFLESNTNVINIPNAIPMSDEEGKTQSDAFDFAVTSKTSKNENISYSIVLEKLQDDQGRVQLSDKEVKVYLTDFDGNELLLSNVSDISKDYVLYTKTNNHNSTNKEIKDKYKLRVWIDGKNTDIDFNKENDITYLFKLGVKTNVSEIDTEETYVVNYNSNGGTGTMESTAFKQGETKKLSKNTFIKDGYTFKGWSINNSKDVVYTDEEEVSNLTNVYNGVVNLYAVWVKEGVTYQVRYNANGGNLDDLLLTNNENHWMLENGVYKSGNQGVANSISSIKSREFTLTETSTISFDWAVFCGAGDYLYFSIYKDGSEIPLEGTGESTKIGGYSGTGNLEKNLSYKTVTKELESGTYVLEFSYSKDSSIDKGLDAGYVKKLSIPGIDKSVENSTHQTGVKNKLLKNKYERAGYVFKGWSTKQDGNAKYNDEEEVIDLTDENNSVVDLYAVWEKAKYKVNVVVQNGIINGESIKNVDYNESVIFSITPNEGRSIGLVKCTSGQKGTYHDTEMVIKNVKNDTTCTINVTNELTVLHKDGTFVINEQQEDRNSNILKHGRAIREYDAMGSSVSYSFDNILNLPIWTDERELIRNVDIGRVIQPISTASWFVGTSIESGDFSNLDVSKVKSMKFMFNGAGYNAGTFNLAGLEYWSPSNVTDMSYMFESAGKNATTWDIGNLSNWDTSSVTNMDGMFWSAGKSATTFNLRLSNWDTSKVTNMSYMFYYMGYNARTFDLDISRWNVTNVIGMSYMFGSAGYNATTWDIGNLSDWNTSNVIYMNDMFSRAGYNATTWNVGDISNWDTSKVTNMSSMFYQAGYKTASWNIGDLSNWDTSKVTSMSSMFHDTGKNTTIWDIGKLSNWNTSNVTNMNNMFFCAGENATTWNIGDLSKWDTSNVTSMHDMFYMTGYNATTWDIGDLSLWNTSSVGDMSGMFYQAGYKTTSWNIGDLSKWDTSNVRSMSFMFFRAGESATTWNIGDLSKWDTSNVTGMSSMFNMAGHNAIAWDIGNLSDWNTSKVIYMNDMFFRAGESATTWNIGDLSNWDTSNVTSMSSMFAYADRKATIFNLDLSNWNTSKVTNMENMFTNAGSSATTWSVKIPSTTGSLTNTTSKWYGKTESVYAEPTSGKSFTLS